MQIGRVMVRGRSTVLLVGASVLVSAVAPGAASAQTRLGHGAAAERLVVLCDDAASRFDSLNERVGQQVTNPELRGYLSASDSILRTFESRLNATRGRVVADDTVIRALKTEISRQRGVLRRAVRLAAASRFDEARAELVRTNAALRDAERIIQQRLIDADLPTCAYLIDEDDPLDPATGTPPAPMPG